MPDGLATSPIPLAPPPAVRFRSAGGVRRAWSCEGPFSRAPLRGTAAQRAGIRYERKAHKFLASAFPGIIRSPWYQFIDGSGRTRYCQPDSVLDIGGGLLLFEIKIRFGADAWYQMESLYKPVVEAVFGKPVAACVVVCKHFDPSVLFPVPFRLLPKHTVEEVLREAAKVGVMQWLP